MKSDVKSEILMIFGNILSKGFIFEAGLLMNCVAVAMKCEKVHKQKISFRIEFFYSLKRIKNENFIFCKIKTITKLMNQAFLKATKIS